MIYKLFIGTPIPYLQLYWMSHLFVKKIQMIRHRFMQIGTLISQTTFWHYLPRS